VRVRGSPVRWTDQQPELYFFIFFISFSSDGKSNHFPIALQQLRLSG
jgi:hypothetical protein